ncbi:MAG TPA: dehypoxanthine futalosine cyclase, partial [Candidatus Latescibacteria bacterium]|nr:dehypoxanthine futalosine cyclase [Candidatus Latescibacterota bacterium]
MSNINDITEKIQASERISLDDARRLIAHPNVAEIGLLANTVRERLHPVDRVTYNIGRNINYTNVCWVKCDFC